MILIVGLGNPEGKFRNNRHNVGHVLIDKLKEVKNTKTKNLLVIKTDCYMNDSGSFVKDLLFKYKDTSLSDLYIIHDDLDIKLGEYKIQFAKGPKDHNGLNDIYEKLGTKDFWHVRIGVDNRDPDKRISGEEYVLEDFTDREKHIINSTLFKICKKLVTL